MRHPFRFTILLFIVLVIGIFAYAERVGIREWVQEHTKPTLPTAESYEEHAEIVSEDPSATTQDREENSLPSEKLLAVPFMSQAPHANWDMPYQEACEEASILMVAGYYRGERGAYMADAADTMLLELLDFEEQEGFKMDISVKEAKELIEMYYPDLTATVKTIQKGDEIRSYIAQGIPVIVPADGKVLPNPNFQNGGPIYHMLVVTGYTKDGQFITNDPGTRLGQEFLYEEEPLINAIHDWNNGKVSEGDRVVLIVTKKS